MEVQLGLGQPVMHVGRIQVQTGGDCADRSPVLEPLAQDIDAGPRGRADLLGSARSAPRGAGSCDPILHGVGHRASSTARDPGLVLVLVGGPDRHTTVLAAGRLDAAGRTSLVLDRNTEGAGPRQLGDRQLRLVFLDASDPTGIRAVLRL